MKVFGYLGDIPLGVDAFTGPQRLDEKFKAAFPEHKLARGKPMPQDVGDELDQQSMEFFFDETFCDPETEAQKIKGAFASRSPMPFVRGSGGYSGQRYVIEEMDIETLRTTPDGRATRYLIKIKLKEWPIPNGLAWLGTLAMQAARALAPFASDSSGARR